MMKKIKKKLNARRISIFAVLMLLVVGLSACSYEADKIDSTAVQFSVETIPDDIFDLMQGKSYTEGAIPREELSYLTITYLDYNGDTQIGNMIVNAQIADITLECFEELYENKFPINKISLIDHYDADDSRSMADDNSSSFCHRVVAGTDRLSNHAMGLAIDINPLRNPYVGFDDNGEPTYDEMFEPYIDRTQNTIGVIKKDDICYEIFTKHGFTWGGDWESPIDYQHFEFKLEE